MTTYAKKPSALDKKLRIYPYIGRLYLDGPNTGKGHGRVEGCGFELDRNGNVYPAKNRRAFKIATGDIWYAVITKKDYDVAWLVRRDKLNKPRMIEKVRWRVYERLVRTMATDAALWEQAKKRGRVWMTPCPFRPGTDEPGFLVWNGLRWNEPPKHDDVITSLGLLPSPIEIKLGAEIEACDKRLIECRGHAQMMDEILSVCFELHSDYERPTRCRLGPGERQHRVEINSRVYYMTTQQAVTYGVEEKRAWPAPADHVTAL